MTAGFFFIPFLDYAQSDVCQSRRAALRKITNVVNSETCAG